jgi:membrane protein required for colicin V production
MTWLDWIIIAVLFISVMVAAAQGFFVEIFSLGGAILAYLLAAWEYWRLAPWFAPYVKSEALANAAAFGVIFICVAVLAGAIGRIARWVFREVGLSWVDRLLGAAFGIVRGVLVVAVMVMALATFVPQSTALKQSVLAGYFLVAGHALKWVAPSGLRQKFQQGVALIRGIPAQPK